jgi:hypothetical protein
LLRVLVVVRLAALTRQAAEVVVVLAGLLVGM